MASQAATDESLDNCIHIHFLTFGLSLRLQNMKFVSRDSAVLRFDVIVVKLAQRNTL